MSANAAPGLTWRLRRVLMGLAAEDAGIRRAAEKVLQADGAREQRSVCNCTSCPSASGLQVLLHAICVLTA